MQVINCTCIESLLYKSVLLQDLPAAPIRVPSMQGCSHGPLLCEVPRSGEASREARCNVQGEGKSSSFSVNELLGVWTKSRSFVIRKFIFAFAIVFDHKLNCLTSTYANNERHGKAIFVALFLFFCPSDTYSGYMPHNWSGEADSPCEPGGIYHMLDPWLARPSPGAL